MKSFEIQKNKNRKMSTKRQYKFQFSIFGKGPFFDWVFLMIVFLITLICINIYTYSKYQNFLHEVIGESQSVTSPQNDLPREHIEKLIEEYKKREEVLNNFE